MVSLLTRRLPVAMALLVLQKRWGGGNVLLRAASWGFSPKALGGVAHQIDGMFYIYI
jgi:hypothetical protein